MLKPTIQKHSDTGQFAISCTLILVAPFIVYVSQQGYLFSFESAAIVFSIALGNAIFGYLASFFPEFVRVIAISICLALVFEYFTDVSLKIAVLLAAILAFALSGNIVIVSLVALAAFNLSTTIVTKDFNAQVTVISEPIRPKVTRPAGPLIHLILDAQTSIEGISDEYGARVMGRLKQSLLDNNFFVYGNGWVSP